MARKYVTKKCFGKKSDAKQEQKSMHAKGQTARVVKKDGRFCVQSAGARKKK